jgi:hypothetical protein
LQREIARTTESLLLSLFIAKVCAAFNEVIQVKRAMSYLTCELDGVGVPKNKQKTENRWFIAFLFISVFLL